VIVVDTSVWADHLRAPNPALGALYAANAAVMHPFVIGELAAGRMPHWRRTVTALRLLKRAPVVAEDVFYDAVVSHDLMGTGLGFVDLHLLISTLNIETGLLWTRDRRLAAQAQRFSRAYVSV
jgi:predicted nucleic acid-binding protein